jgi:hypothetical protein
VEPFSIGAVVAAGMRLGARSCVRLAPAIVVIFGPLVAAVAMGRRGWMPLALLLEVPVAMMVTHAVVGELRGARPSVIASVKAGLRSAVPALCVMAIVCVVAAAVGIGLLLPALGAAEGSGGDLVLVGLFAVWVIVVVMLYSRWFVAMPALVVERPGVFGALRRSTLLTKGRRQQLAALLVIVAAMLVGGSLVVELALDVRASRWFVDPRASSAMAAAGLVLWVLIAVLRASFAAAAYHHLRQDAEGASPEHLDEIFG